MPPAPGQRRAGVRESPASSWAGGRGSPAEPPGAQSAHQGSAGGQDVRKYKRKHARNPDKRMAAAVRLRARGLSLRQIAGELACSYQTVANDIARWERERPNVVQLSNPAVKTAPPRGENLTPEFDSPTNIVELRRKA